ncbi:MAG: hypothetical protein ACI4RN_00755 [Oscillospiraceae bacterium]
MNKLTESELEYIISRVLDNANEAAENADESQFSEGKKLAYYEILDTIKNELIVRDIDVKPLGLDVVLEKLL